MKNSFRKPIFEIIEGLKNQGLDLSADEVSTRIIYPEHPEVLITLTIGGMFFEDPDEGVEVELH